MIKIGSQEAVVPEGINLVACKDAQHGQNGEEKGQKQNQRVI